ncbi:TPA: hypothetical protein PRW13_004844 [Escherichia coli]|nr:hypothetical protein [Escherichia coli]
MSFGISMFSYLGVKDTNVLTFNINSEKVVGVIGLRCLFYVVILIVFVCFEMPGQDEPVIPNDMAGNNCASIPVSCSV